jgi:NAD(P)-dependent dehydrogenase (short-subunit alcohol dehydrogenase family)
MQVSRSRTALVTGAAQGMGAACARRLAHEDVDLVLMDLNDAPLQTLAAELPRATAVVGNVVVRADVERALATAQQAGGGIDILVNAAGVLRPTRVLEITDEEWDQVVGVNLKGSFIASQVCARSMQRSGWGRIVHFSSTAGKTVSTLGGAHYTAAKHGVLGLTRALAKELAASGITANAVCPGLIDTEMVRAAVSPAAIARYRDSFPVGRLGTAEEVAELVAFLVSDRAAYITGAAIDINGGDFLA